MKEKRGKRSSVGKTLMSIDMFGERVGFQIEGMNSYPTACGTIVSILTLALVLIYALKQWTAMAKYNETRFQSIFEPVVDSDVINQDESNIDFYIYVYNFFTPNVNGDGLAPFIDVQVHRVTEDRSLGYTKPSREKIPIEACSRERYDSLNGELADSK